MKLELIVVPVSDLDGAKAFYAGKLGWSVDHDTETADGYRFAQLTPPGSACSIALMRAGDRLPHPDAAGNGILTLAAGSLQGLQLVVADVRSARARLAAQGVEISEVQVFDAGSFRPAVEEDALDNFGFAFFADPDGNGWVLQQMSPGDG